MESNKVIKKLQTKLEKLNILLKYFNENAEILALFIFRLSKNFLIKFYKEEIKKLVKNNSPLLINTFIITTLKYEEEIMEGNDSFFLGTQYEKSLKLGKNDMAKVFEFKKIWNTLTTNNKLKIKSYMKLLCIIARKYLTLTELE